MLNYPLQFYYQSVFGAVENPNRLKFLQAEHSFTKPKSQEPGETVRTADRQTLSIQKSVHMIKGTSEGHGFPKNECFIQKHENSITDLKTTNMIQSGAGR